MTPMISGAGRLNSDTQTPIVDGIVVTARKCPKIVAPATIIIIMQDMRVVSFSAAPKLFQVKFRPIKAIMIVPKAPTAAASVGVKKPTNNPPITRMNRMKDSIMPVREESLSFIGTFGVGTQSPGFKCAQIIMVKLKKMASRFPAGFPPEIISRLTVQS